MLDSDQMESKQQTKNRPAAALSKLLRKTMDVALNTEILIRRPTHEESLGKSMLMVPVLMVEVRYPKLSSTHAQA